MIVSNALKNKHDLKQKQQSGKGQVSRIAKNLKRFYYARSVQPNGLKFLLVLSIKILMINEGRQCFGLECHKSVRTSLGVVEKRAAKRMFLKKPHQIKGCQSKICNLWWTFKLRCFHIRSKNGTLGKISKSK